LLLDSAACARRRPWPVCEGFPPECLCRSGPRSRFCRGVLLGTRNFKQKAITHNSKVSFLKHLIEELLKEGFCILNLGTPAMPLDINNNDYYEVSHNMPIDDKCLICGAATACIMTAEAGLFTAFAATNLSLIQYDGE
jgi:hypothetical protein